MKMEEKAFREELERLKLENDLELKEVVSDEERSIHKDDHYACFDGMYYNLKKGPKALEGLPLKSILYAWMTERYVSLPESIKDYFYDLVMGEPNTCLKRKTKNKPILN